VTVRALLIFAALTLLLGSCSKNPSSPTETGAGDVDQQVSVDPSIVAWLKAKCLPFDTPKAESGFADIAYLKDLVAGARVVELGEATHGTKEFSQMKHRILEYLVKEMGFNTFAIEANWPEANLLNDYVMTGQGDPARLLAGLYFWTWNTQEVLDMIRWMRRHNENPGSAPKVGFFGFDMQYPKMAMDNVIAYLTKVDPPAALRAYSLYLPYRPYQNNSTAYGIAPDSVKTTCRRYMTEVYDSLASHRLEYESRSSSKEYSWGLQSARVAVQGEAVLSKTGQGNRDYFMAENARWLLDQAGLGGKIVLWAHNGHVSTLNLRMGNYLRSWYGDQMVVFGFDFYVGSFNAYPSHGGIIPSPVTSLRAENPYSDSYEYVFRGANIPRFFLDMRDPSSPPSVGSWILGPRQFRSIGATYDDVYPRLYFYSTQLPKEFDVVVYFQDTAPSVLLPF
jgi:erythromycin esterase